MIVVLLKMCCYYFQGAKINKMADRGMGKGGKVSGFEFKVQRTVTGFKLQVSGLPPIETCFAFHRVNREMRRWEHISAGLRV